MTTKIGYASREELIAELRLRLGDGMVDVELDRAHYDTAINLAMGKYRQLSAGATEESTLFISAKEGVTEYTLPAEVIEVRRLYRRGVSASTGGSEFNPFDSAFSNMYMYAGQGGGLALFDALAIYKEGAERIFGGQYNFQWNRNTKVLTILRNVTREEDIAVGIHNLTPESTLLTDIYASQWLSAYALAQSKLMMGRAYIKYSSGLPGAGGGITLAGNELLAEGKEEVEKLELAIHNMEEGNSPLGFLIG